MILTLIASGHILSRLCVAPMNTAPAQFDRTGFSPVTIQIEQIKPIPSPASQDVDDLRAEVDTEDSGSAAQAMAPAETDSSAEGEITIKTGSPDMQGSIPGRTFRGPRSITARLATRAAHQQALPVAKAAKVTKAAPKTAPIAAPVVAQPVPAPTPTLDGAGEQPFKVVPVDGPTETSTTEPTSPEPQTISSPAPAPTPISEGADIDGMYTCSAESVDELTSFLRSKFPGITLQVGMAKPSSQMGRMRKHHELRTILFHGPPSTVADALDAAQRHCAPHSPR